MNSDSYQNKQVTGSSDTAGEEMETGKDISNVSHKHTVLIMAGSLLTLLFWIAMADHSGGARGGQYATASGDGMTQEGGGALAADLFKLGSEVELPHDRCGPDCQGLVAKVRGPDSDPIPWCVHDQFTTVNGVEYCFAPCDVKPEAHWCDGDRLFHKNLSGVTSMFTGGGGGCVTEDCRTGYGHGDHSWGDVDVCPSQGSWDYQAYLCQKTPTVNPPAPYDADHWCDGDEAWKGPDGLEYCWSTCAANSGQRSCNKKAGFWRLLSYHRHCHVAAQISNLCQKNGN